MTKGSALVLRIYFGLVSAVTLFTLMFGSIDFLSDGLKTYIFTAADVPAYGLMNCDSPDAKYQFGNVPMPTEAVPGATKTLSAEETKARCDAANATTMETIDVKKHKTLFATSRSSSCHFHCSLSTSASCIAIGKEKNPLNSSPRGRPLGRNHHIFL